MEDKRKVMDHAHTLIVLAAFVAALAVRAVDPSAVSEELVWGLAAGVLGTAGTRPVR